MKWLALNLAVFFFRPRRADFGSECGASRTRARKEGGGGSVVVVGEGVPKDLNALQLFLSPSSGVVYRTWQKQPSWCFYLEGL